MSFSPTGNRKTHNLFERFPQARKVELLSSPRPLEISDVRHEFLLKSEISHIHRRLVKIVNYMNTRLQLRVNGQIHIHKPKISIRVDPMHT